MSDFAYPLHEECGVFGIYDRAGTEDVAAAAYSALYALQHRGQESCGIAVNDDGVIQRPPRPRPGERGVHPGGAGHVWQTPRPTWQPAMSAMPRPAAGCGPTPSP